MRIFVDGQNISQLVEKIEWGGDTKQVARTLSFTIVKNQYDKYLPKVTIATGATVIMQTGRGVNLFIGKMLKPERSSSGNTVSYLCYDLMFYVFNSSSSWVIDETPEQFVTRVCAEFGIKQGFTQTTDVPVYSLALNKTGYQAIMMAYTEAYRQNNKAYAYIPLMDGDALTVIPKGMDSEVVLEVAAGREMSGNLIDTSYSEDATKVVNRVVIKDKQGNTITTIDDAESQSKYGTIQKSITKEEGKDSSSEASSMMHDLERAASASGLSDTRAVAGWSLLIRDPDTGLLGRFFIESDKHSFSDGKGTMDLTLEFKGVMDEQDLEQQKEENAK